MNTNKLLRIGALSCAVGLCFTSPTWAQDYIAPAMVNIPAGDFNMGTNVGADLAKPMHKVEMTEFQLAKYPVTMAEFRLFAEQTGYNPDPTCDDFISENWMSGPGNKGSASWDTHQHVISEYQPVSCVSFQDARDYAAWLTEKTGINYRLPTEQEWEYATKANTTSRYFWGDDPDLSQACLYGNFPDHSGEYFASKDYGASYVGFLGHANCDDGEPYVTLVGMYRPNPFGLYDMLGNNSQYLATCYYPGYQDRTEEEMDIEKCEMIAHRGFDWHFPPVPHAERGRTTKKWSHGSDIGFRLAADGHSKKVDPTTLAFEHDLKAAQIKRLKTRPSIPNIPEHVQLIASKEKYAQLSWQPSNDVQVTAYDIYQSNAPFSHLLGGFYKNHYQKITSVKSNVNRINVELPAEGASYRVVSVKGELTSLPSEATILAPTTAETIPGRLNMQHATSLENVLLAHRKASDEKPELFYMSRFFKGYEQPQVTAAFNVTVKKSAWYRLNYNGSSNQTGEFFKIWQNNSLVAKIDFNADIDDTKSSRHKVYLEQGNHQLQLSVIREGYDFLGLGWLEFTEIKSES